MEELNDVTDSKELESDDDDTEVQKRKVKPKKRFEIEGGSSTECELCGKTFNNSSFSSFQLKRHIRTHHKKRYEKLNDVTDSMEQLEKSRLSTECQLCGKIFTENRHMKRHIQTVHEGYEQENLDAAEVKIENPRTVWDVKSLYEYQYFNCPSCSYKSDYKQDFVNHTFNTHPESVDFFRKISDGSLDDIITPWNKIAQTYGDLFFELKAKKLGPNAQKHCYIMEWIQVNVFQKNTLTKIETECS